MARSTTRDTLFAGLTDETLRWLEATLSNDESSTDAELQTYFVAGGLTAKQAMHAVSQRTSYLNHLRMDG